MVGLSNVDNTSDVNKPVSTATQTALNLKAPLESPTLAGTPISPTAAAGTNTTQLATTAFVLANAGGVSLSANNNWTGIQTFQNGKLGLRNTADTFTSYFSNANTASRTYTLPNRDMTVAGTDEVILLTGNQTATGRKSFSSNIRITCK